MTGIPAPATGRRVPRGLFGALVVFLFLPLPPLCLAGPLLLRLLVTGPRGARAWAWTGAAALLTASALAGAGGGPGQAVVLAYGAAFAGSFVALMTWRPGPVFSRATAAALDTAVLVALGAWVVGLDWTAVRAAFDAQFQDAVAFVVERSGMPAERAAALRTMMGTLAGVYPGLAVLGAMAGGPLANAIAWYVTDGRSGAPPAPFRSFRFNDHVVWGVIATLGMALAPLPAPVRTVAANGLVVWAGVYIARGLAVCSSRSDRWSPVTTIALFLGGVLLLPYALAGLLLMGLADTWLDFRRPSAPPSQGVDP